MNSQFSDNNREILEIHTSCCLERKNVRSKMERIREKLENLLGYDRDEIRLIGIEPGCLTFVFSLPEVTTENLTDLYKSGIWSINVFKIETACYIIEPGNIYW